MSILISGSAGIDMGNLPVSNASQVEVQDNQVSPFGGFKNYIINGNFDVWQYGTSQTSTGYGSDDRWLNSNAGSTKTHSQVTCTDTERALFNTSKFSRTVVSSVVGAYNHVVKRTAIEDVTKLAGKTITLSFWAKTDSNKNIWLEFKQSFGTGGSPSAQVNGIYAQAIALTTTWQKKTITLTLPSIVGKTLGTDGVHTSCTEVQFWFDVGSASTGRILTGIQQSGTFDIAQVQLEEGSVATPFENRPYALELPLCKRYARDIGNSSLYGQIGNGFAISTTSALIEIDVNDMRIVPTISNTLTANLFEIEYANGAGTSRATCTAIAINSSATANNNKLNLIITVGGGLTAGQCVGFRNNNTSTNKIILSAEL